MNKNILFNRLTATFSSILIAGAFASSASAIDYTTKAINAYDHTGNLISSHVASDVQYIEIEDRSLESEAFAFTGINGEQMTFKMIPVIGNNSYRLKSVENKWPEKDKIAPVKTFYIGETLVTNALWEAVMGSLPSGNSGSDYPVRYVSWYDICQTDGFLDRLNHMVKEDPTMRKLMGDYEFCLPNEWEWEYAASGGNQSNNYPYSGSNKVDDVAWYYDNASSTIHPVAAKLPNELGIYDMSGNLWEWCSENHYRANSGAYQFGQRNTRGGSFETAKDRMNLAGRYNVSADARSPYFGFRIALKEKAMRPETYTISDEKGTTVKFNMIPVEGTDSYSLKYETNWPENERYTQIPSFHIGELEVTNSLWQAVMGYLPSKGNSDGNYPVNNINWNDICGPGGFLETLNAKMQQDPEMREQLNGRKFCLPNEWEWEYAAGAGNHYDKYKYSGSSTIDDVAWYGENSGNASHPVAEKQPNGLGLYDMSGNVWELCSDNPYRKNDGTYLMDERVARGGAFTTPLDKMEYTGRYSATVDVRSAYFGFRLILK